MFFKEKRKHGDGHCVCVCGGGRRVVKEPPKCECGVLVEKKKERLKNCAKNVSGQ